MFYFLSNKQEIKQECIVFIKKIYILLNLQFGQLTTSLTSNLRLGCVDNQFGSNN